MYGLLIEYSINAQGSMQQALQLVEQMMDRHLSPGQHLGPDVLAAVQQVSGRPATCPAPLGSTSLMQIHTGCVGLALDTTAAACFVSRPQTHGGRCVQIVQALGSTSGVLQQLVGLQEAGTAASSQQQGPQDGPDDLPWIRDELADMREDS